MLADALEHLVKGIVDHPDEVRINESAGTRGEILEVHVHPEDLGRVIGRCGRTAQALRTVVAALATGERVRVDIVDTDTLVAAAGRSQACAAPRQLAGRAVCVLDA